MTGAPPDPLIAFAAAADAAHVANLSTFPDWFLAAFAPDDLTPSAVFAAYLLRARRAEPDVPPAEAFDRFRRESPEALGELARAFALSCSLERLKRAGLLEGYTTTDPFSLDGVNSCTLPAGDTAFYRSNPSPEPLRRYVRARLQQAHPAFRHRSN
jgi:hypothetical protein